MDSLEWYKYYRANEYGTKSADMKLTAVDNIVKAIVNEIKIGPIAVENSPFVMEIKNILERKAELNYVNWSRQAIDLMDGALIIAAVWEVLQDPEYSVKLRRPDCRSWVFGLNHIIMDQQQKNLEGILQKNLSHFKNWVREQNAPKPQPKPAPIPTEAPPAAAAAVSAAYKVGGTPAPSGAAPTPPSPQPNAVPNAAPAPAPPQPTPAPPVQPHRHISATAPQPHRPTPPPRPGASPNTPTATNGNPTAANRPVAPRTPNRPGTTAANVPPRRPTAAPRPNPNAAPARPGTPNAARGATPAPVNQPPRPTAKAAAGQDVATRLTNVQNELAGILQELQDGKNNQLRQMAMGQIELYNRIARVHDQHLSLAESSNNPDYLDAVNAQKEYMDFIVERLSNLGVEKISTRPGTPFDSRRHETSSPNVPIPTGATVKKTLSPGFRNGDSVWLKEKVEI